MFPWGVIFLFCLVKNLFGDESASTLLMDDDISYEDLKELNITCYPKDTCMEDITGNKTCSCDSQCSMFGTCCVDSPYRDYSAPTHQCRAMNEDDGYYMVQRCLSNTDSNSMWKHMCESDEGGDILKRVPVTSMDTNTTYKDYYCFRCHETTENFLYWQMDLPSLSEGTTKMLKNTNISWTYNERTEIWVATNGEEYICIPVREMSFSAPDKMPFKPRYCDPYMISDCPVSWTDENIRNKCHAYAAGIYTHFGKSFKNVHCALCNSVDLEDIFCRYWTIFGPPPESIDDGYSDFRYIFDFRQFDEDKDGAISIDLNQNKNRRISKCADGEFWQPFNKKCKKIICAVEGYVIKNGKCAAP